MIASISFIVTNEAQYFKWAGYGLNVSIPQGSLPANLKECRFLIKIGLSGQLALPQNTTLVSGVYWLDTEPCCKFSKPIVLEVQHCANPTQTSELSFIHARCSQKELPYDFKTLEGGAFTPHSSYGTIPMSHFSIVAVTQKGKGDPKYCAGLYYVGSKLSSLIAHFVITKNFDACITVSYH